jgi:hypothetical protein
LRELARAVMRQRLERVTIAARDPLGAADQFVYWPGNGAGEDEADNHSGADHGQRRQQEFSTLLIEMVEDIARRSRCVDHARHVVIDDHRHRGEDVNADATADGIDRRWGLVRNAGP